MKNPDKKHNYGCLFLIIIFAVIVILIRYSDSIENAKSQRYHELMIQVSQEPNSEKALEIFKEAYKNATSKNERRRARSGIIALYEQMGNYSKAHSHLDEFIDEFESSKYTDIHRAILYGKEGKTDKAIEKFELVLKENKVFEEPGIIKSLWNYFLDSGSGEEQLKIYYDYFLDYVCNMVALGYESYMISDSIERLKNKERFFLLNPQIDDVAQSYINYKIEHPKSYGMFEAEKTDIMQRMHLGLWTTAINTNTLIEDIYRMKWNFTTFFLIEYDHVFGYQETKQIMKNILKNNHTTSEKFPKFLIDAYMSIDEPDAKSSITYDDFKSFQKEGLTFIVKLTPTTALSTESSFIKEGITDSRILLRCNDWDFSQRTPFLSDSIYKYKGKTKRIILLSDDYKTDTLNITTDKLGVMIEHVVVPTALYELLLHDFSDYQVTN